MVDDVDYKYKEYLLLFVYNLQIYIYNKFLECYKVINKLFYFVLLHAINQQEYKIENFIFILNLLYEDIFTYRILYMYV